MLVELKDVEAHIEPSEIISQALSEGDITVDRVIYECISEESTDAVLEAIDHESIKQYCYSHDINIELNYFPQIAEAIKEFSSEEKALLLWQLLKCEEV